VVISRFHILTILFALGLSAAGHAQSSDAARIQELVKESFEKNDWEAATKHAMLLSRVNRQSKEAKEQLRTALRRWTQQRRLHDQTSLDGLAELPQPQLLRLYGEALSRLQTCHIDRQGVAPARLFQQGIDEFDRALSDPIFQQRFLRSLSSASIDRLRSKVHQAGLNRLIDSPNQAQIALSDLVRSIRREYQIEISAAVVLEFLCGACHSLDEYTHYISAADLIAEMDEIGETNTVMDVMMLKDQIGYLRIGYFRETTLQEFDMALQQLRMTGMMMPLKGLIIDLRGNPGGSLLVATQVAERFVANGILASTMGPLTEVTRIYSASNGSMTLDVPLAVLVDGQTASAAEVLAITLREHRRAKVVGTTTFGKGTLQALVRLSTGETTDDMGRLKSRGALRITLAKILSPSGSAIGNVGAQPDVPESDRDRQLQLAIDAVSR
jgi:hypothetical protein